MASNDINSNLSIGALNAPDNGSGPSATSLYNLSSRPPGDEIAYSLRTTTGLKRNEFPSERPKYYMKFDVSQYHRLGGGNMFQVRLDAFDTFILPLPQNLIDVHPVQYDETPLGALLGNSFDAIQGAMKNIQTGTSDVQGSFSAAAAAVTAAGAGLIDKVTDAPITQLASNISSLAGYSPNQFLTILLKGPKYKQHKFSWVLSPRNEQEAEALRGIIKDFNNYMSPGVVAGGALFTFPMVFQMAFMPNPKYMFKFKPAVLTDFAVDFAGGGMPAFFRKGSQYNDGLNAPMMITMSMTFLELEYWLSGNYTDTNEAYDTYNGTPFAAPSSISQSPSSLNVTDPNASSAAAAFSGG